MLGTDVAVSELQRLPQRQLKDLLRSRVKGGEPDGAVPDRPMVSSTFSRTAVSEMSSSRRALAATPSPS